jgi:hypothetical protein
MKKIKKNEREDAPVGFALFLRLLGALLVRFYSRRVFLPSPHQKIII